MEQPLLNLFSTTNFYVLQYIRSNINEIVMRFPTLPIFVQLLMILACVILFGDLLPKSLQAVLYSISLTLKGLLLFIIPIIIFLCLLSSVLSLRGKATISFMLIILSIVCLSNYAATMIAYGVASLDLVSIDISSINIDSDSELLPLWDIAFPELLSNNYALLLALCSGFFLFFFPDSLSHNISTKAKYLVSLFFDKFFIPLLPLFILGFIFKMQVEGMLFASLRLCVPLMILIVLTYILYITFLFAIVAKFNFDLWWQYIKNTLPAAIVGFSTMSSLVAMPLTMNAATQNTGSQDLSCLIIPLTVNIHTIGLAINIPLIALSILSNSGFSLPAFTTYSEFAFYFVLMQFGIAAAPGCGILLMIPLLEKYFGFTDNMSALIAAIYILFDPAETSTNILGNSVLTIALLKYKNILYIKS